MSFSRKKQEELSGVTVKPSEENEREASKILKDNNITEQFCLSNSLNWIDLKNIIAYLDKYRSIEFKDDKIDWQEGVSRAFNAVPWMAQKNDNYYVKSINYLHERGIVNYDNNCRELVLSGKSDTYDSVELSNAKNVFDLLCQYIEAYSGRKIVLKMSVFHARSFTQVNNENRLLNLIKKNPNLKVELLCVGKHSGDTAWEGASKKQLKTSIQKGMLRLYDLAYWYRKQVKVRIVRDKEADTAFRGFIVIADDKLEHCYFTMWRYGQERANYGTIYDVPKDSTLAKQLNQMFDNAFKRAIPAKRNFEWITYWFRRGVRYITIIFVLAILQWLLLGNGLDTNLNKESNILIVFISLLVAEIVKYGIEYLLALAKK